MRQPIQVSVTATELDNGIKLMFRPEQTNMRESLRDRLDDDAEQLTSGRCATPSSVSMSTQ